MQEVEIDRSKFLRTLGRYGGMDLKDKKNINLHRIRFMNSICIVDLFRLPCGEKLLMSQSNAASFVLITPIQIETTI